MPITPASLTPSLVGPFKAFGLNGPSALQLAQGFASAYTQWLATIPVVTNHVGVLGAGTGTGKVFLNPVTGPGLLTSNLASAGIKGPSASGLAAGVASAIASEMNLNAIVQVAIAGTSTGTGTGRLSLASSAALVALLTPNFTSVALLGVSAPLLAQGLGLGIGTWIKTARVQTVDVGTPAPLFPSSTGVGTGKVF